MQVTCIRRGEAHTYTNVESAEQYHGSVIIQRSNETSDRLIPDARLVEATADNPSSLIAEVSDSSGNKTMTNVDVVRERDDIVRAWDSKSQQTEAQATKRRHSCLHTVTEIAAVSV